MNMPTAPELAAKINRWFSELPGDIRDEITSRCERRVVAAGERLWARGDPCDGMMLVLEGSVRASGRSASGEETVLDFYGPGSWIGEVAALGLGRRNHDAVAYMPSLLLHLGLEDLEDLLRRRPEFARRMLRLQALRLQILLVVIEEYSVETMEQRLANRLLMLMAAYGVEGAHGIEFNLHLPQEVLAQLIGSTRQRVNHILKSWEEVGVVERRYGSVVVRDAGALQRLAAH